MADNETTVAKSMVLILGVFVVAVPILFVAIMVRSFFNFRSDTEYLKNEFPKRCCEVEKLIAEVYRYRQENQQWPENVEQLGPNGKALLPDGWEYAVEYLPPTLTLPGQHHSYLIYRFRKDEGDKFGGWTCSIMEGYKVPVPCRDEAVVVP